MSTLSLTPFKVPPHARERGGASPHADTPRAGTDTGVRHFIELKENALLALKSCQIPRAIRCIEGQVWITQEGDDRDCLLHPGKVWRPSTAGKTVVTALSAAKVELCSE